MSNKSCLEEGIREDEGVRGTRRERDGREKG